MGYRDFKLLLNDSQTVTEEVSDYYIDTEQEYPGWDKGSGMAVVVSVETAATGTTGFVLSVCHKDSGAPTLGDSTLIAMTVPVANLTKGAEIVIPIPQGVPVMRYLGLNYGNITGDESMVCSAWVTPYPATR